jgi:AcrR family transcriptional regulator
MAIDSSQVAGSTRRATRRLQTIEEALDQAVAIMEADGVGALSMSEIARRLGIRQPSLYKYFPSLHAVYDALFARGLALMEAAVMATVTPLPAGVARIRAGAKTWIRCAVDNPALAQLLVWRPVPGFQPTEETFVGSMRQMDQLRTEFAAAVDRGELSPEGGTPEALRVYTMLLSGVISQQMANQPGAAFDTGLFTSLIDDALDMFFARYSVL